MLIAAEQLNRDDQTMTDTFPKIQAVLFDADGVVQTTKPGWFESLSRLSGSPDNAEQFLANVFDAERSCFTGSGDFAHSLAEVLKKWGSETPVSEALKVSSGKPKISHASPTSASLRT